MVGFKKINIFKTNHLNPVLGHSGEDQKPNIIIFISPTTNFPPSVGYHLVNCPHL
jgi:hypothetical protein